MDSNGHDLVIAHDNPLATSTLNMLQSWPLVDLTSLSHAQWYSFHLDNWSQRTLAGPMENHGPFPTVVSQTETWNDTNQDCTNNQRMQVHASWTSPPGPSTIMVMSHDNVISPYNIDELALGESRPCKFTNATYSGVGSRESNHYSDPVIWTTSQHETRCQLPTDIPSPMNPVAMFALRQEANATERLNEAYLRPLTVQRRQRMCYDHGCNGREFSSIGNLRRHQRERAGRTPLSFCSWCGATFYRRWTRDHHVMRRSCSRVPR
jgi:hypothetical protein